jgi:hypothetical protein
MGCVETLYLSNLSRKVTCSGSQMAHALTRDLGAKPDVFRRDESNVCWAANYMIRVPDDVRPDLLH